MSFVSYLDFGKDGLSSAHYNMDQLLYEVQEVIAVHPKMELIMKEQQKYILDTLEYRDEFTVIEKPELQWSLDSLPNVPAAISPPPLHAELGKDTG
jgi:exopolysaccharide biosynthesis predicted pyruvyltransferase EpsI